MRPTMLFLAALRSDAPDGVGGEMAAAVQLLWQCFCMRPSIHMVSTVDGLPIVFFVMEGCVIEMVGGRGCVVYWCGGR